MRSVSVLMVGLLVALSSPGSAEQSPGQSLQNPSAFDRIQDRAQRSRVIFTEIGKVLTHPRCMNCHPAGDQPLQGADHHVHFPPAHRGGPGVVADACAACHTDRNVTLHVTAPFRSIPGHPRWDLAPREAAWEKKSLTEICAQLKDKQRNGGRDLAMLQEHVAKDDLVAWGWHPGEGREPAPGSQEQAGRLMQSWIDTGAECP